MPTSTPKKLHDFSLELSILFCKKVKAGLDILHRTPRPGPVARLGCEKARLSEQALLAQGRAGAGGAGRNTESSRAHWPWGVKSAERKD